MLHYVKEIKKYVITSLAFVFIMENPFVAIFLRGKWYPNSNLTKLGLEINCLYIVNNILWRIHMHQLKDEQEG